MGLCRVVYQDIQWVNVSQDVDWIHVTVIIFSSMYVTGAGFEIYTSQVPIIVGDSG
jgi:hypothetical protein